jgi:hypothetical protein
MPARSSKLGRFFSRPSRPASSRAARPNLRQRHFEPLEDRRLLALTIITPEWSPQYPNWFYDMGRAVVSRDGTFDTRDLNTDGIADAIQNSRVVWSGTPAPVGTQQKIDDLILFDWFSMGDTPGTADSDPVAQALVAAIHDRLADVDSGVLDLHFIGHGRGAYANAEVLRRLANDPLAARIGFVQMTTLDPLNDGDDGVLDSNPGGLVDFADNYYQQVPEEGNFHGALVPGALNFRLNPQMNAWAGRSNADAGFANHQEVHDWYLWTIDSNTVADDEPTLVDAATPVPTAADREMLYDSIKANLNNDGQLDDFSGGTHIGYYFSIAGGAIGNVAYRANEVYTIDLRTGAVPLYLGTLEEDSPILGGLTHAPNGDLTYFSVDFRKLSRARISFDEDNHPLITETRFGQQNNLNGVGSALQFAPDGKLIMADAAGYLELSPTSGLTLGSKRAQNFNLLVEQPFAFAHNGNGYYVKATDFSLVQKLYRVSQDLSQETELRSLPFKDVISLAVVDGLLYCFRPGGYVTLNLASLQIVDEVSVVHPELDGEFTVSSLVTSRAPVWHNRDLRADVTGDGRVTTNDVIAVVNTILSKGTRTIDPADLLSFYYDANNDGRVTTADLVIVINHILQAQTETAPLASEPLAAPAVEVNSAVQPNPADFSKAIADHNAAAEFNSLAFALALQGIEDEEPGF